MSQHETPHDVDEQQIAREAPSDDFDAEVPSEPPSSPSQDDWPEGEPDADPSEALVTPEDQVGPALGERFADVHAERPWLLPGIAVGAALAIAGLVVLLRRR